MGYPIYRCNADFPDRIPQLLQGIGATVERMPSKTFRSFAWRLTRGLGAVQIGGREEDGEMAFHVIWGRNLNPFTWWSSGRLSREVEERLKRAGARPAWIEEKKDGAEQAGGTLRR